MKKKPLLIRGFGVYCSQSTLYNPKIIEVLYQKKNSNKFISLGNFKLSLSIGTQLLTTEETIFSDIEKIKFIIKETYGGNKIFINNIYLYEYLPSVDITMSYQNTEKGENTSNIINKNIFTNNSKTLNLADLSMNDITKEMCDNNAINEEIKKNAKIFSNNLPTRTTEILITESDLTDKKQVNKKNNFLSLEIKNNNMNDNKNKFKKIISESNNLNKNQNLKIEEEKQNNAYTSFNEDLLQKNIAVHTNPKDIFNNSNIFTTNDLKNFTTENNFNENMLNTISNLSNINNYDKINAYKMNVKNKFNEYDVRVANIEKDVNNLKELINEVLNNLNRVMLQNKNKDENEYNFIMTECKNYVDSKINNICETLGNNQKNYYYDTQPYIYNQSYSINSNVIHPNLYNASEIFYNTDNKNSSIENMTYKTNNTNANINLKASHNFRNKMNISKIFNNQFKKPQLTQQFDNTSNHKKNFNSLKREKSLDALSIKKNILLNKNLLKKNQPKKIKKEKEKAKEVQIEKILTKKLNKKLNNINEEIEDKIYKSILKPTLRELEKNLQNNFESIKEKLRSHSVNFSHPNIKTSKSNRPKNINIINKENNCENINNSIDTENIKKNIVEKQHQLNELLLKLNKKQNQSLNYFISFRKDK